MVRTHFENEFRVNFVYWGISSEFRHQKDVFLENKNSDGPQRWCIVITWSMGKILLSGLVPRQVKFEIDIYPIFGMISPLSTFHQSYLTFLLLNIHQKYIPMTPITISTTPVPKTSIQNTIPVHYTLICVHGLIFCKEAQLTHFLCPTFLSPIGNHSIREEAE